jgi:hypothetical protein
MQHPELKPTNWKAFLPWLGYQTQTSCNAGIIKLQGSEFLLGDDNEIYTGENLIHLMKQIEGRSVDAYWLDDNNGGVLKALIFLGDKCICEALPKPTYNRATIERTAKDENNRAIMSAYVATIEGFMRKKAAGIDNVLVIDNRPKTINNKFVIPGLKATTVSDDKVEILPDLPDEDDYVITQTSAAFVKPLKDRF